MAVPCAVTVSTDLSHGGSLHLYVPIPFVPVVPVVVPAVEVPCPAAWPIGVALGSVKKSSTVLANGRAIIQQLHDSGKVIPQITIPPNNTFLPLHLVSSARETIVNCFSVRVDGAQVACTTIWLPMLSCGQPVSVPLTFTPTNVMRGIFVGLSAADIIGAIVSTVIRMAVERLLFPIDKLPFFGELGKALLGAVGGFWGSVVQHVMDPRYPISVFVKLKAAGLEFTAGVQFGSSDKTNNPSSVTVGVAKKYNPDIGQFGGGNVKAGITYTWDAGADNNKTGVKAEVAGQVGGGIAGASAKGSVEYHPDADPGNRVAAKAEVKGDLPGGTSSASAKATDDPNAPAGTAGVKGTASAGIDGPGGKQDTKVTGSAPLPSAGAAKPHPPSGVWGPAL